jgi:hypothetical protein
MLAVADDLCFQFFTSNLQVFGIYLFKSHTVCMVAKTLALFTVFVVDVVL